MTDPTSPPQPDDREEAGGVDLPAGAFDGALAHAFRSMVSDEGAEDIVEQIAQGGMGRIYRIRDHSLDRTLAMKVLRPDVNRGFAARRLIQEAKVTARLDHPGVVPVHKLTTDDAGRPRFTMRLVSGDTLADVLVRASDGDAEWNAPRLTQVLTRVCETMAYAHAHGVIHRDLKPANIMVGQFGEVYVMDWGLCKVTGQAEDVAGAPATDDASLTLDGEILGTPFYISPEQAYGDLAALDERSDVYSLGAIIYQILAGHPPYAEEGASSAQVLRGVVAGPPEPLSTRAKHAPDELVAIAEKAMAREPADRYESAEALGRDMQRFLDGRAVWAHSRSLWVRLRKWVARNRGLAITGAVACLAVIAGLVASLVFLGEAVQERSEAQWHARTARLSAAAIALNGLDGGSAAAALQRLDAGDASWEARHLRARIDESVAHFPGTVPCFRDADNQVLYLNEDMLLFDPRRWTSTRYKAWPGTATGDHFDGWHVGGRYLAFHSEDAGKRGRFQVHETETGRVFPSVPVDGLRAAWIGGGGQFALWMKNRPPEAEEASVVYELETGREVGRIENGPYAIDLAGRYVLQSGFDEARASLIELATGRRRELPGIVEGVGAGDFTSDGKFVAVVAGSSVHLFDCATAEPALWRNLTAPSSIHAAAFDPSGERLVILLEKHLHVYDALTGRLQRRIMMPNVSGRHLDVGEGDLAATGHEPTPGEVRLWSIDSDPRVLRSHRDYLFSLALSPDAEQIASGGWDGYRPEIAGPPIRIWDRRSGELVAAFGPTDAVVTNLQYRDTAAGRRLLAASLFKRNGLTGAIVYDARTGEVVSESKPRVHGLRLFLDASGTRRLAYVDEESDAVGWMDIASGEMGAVRFEHVDRMESQSAASGCALRSDGKVLATVTGAQAEVGRLWNAETGRALAVLRGHTKQITSFAFSRDGRIATSSKDTTIRVWDAESGRQLAVLEAQAEPIYCVRFDPTGDRLFSGGSGTAIHVWDARRYRLVVELEGHESYVHDLRMTPDGETLISASGDDTIRVWETRPLRERLRERERYRAMRDELRPIVAQWPTAEGALKEIGLQPDWSERKRDVARQIVLARGLR